jgi:ubiquinone/menaquinone biosynthesis C-methylase UbiE
MQTQEAYNKWAATYDEVINKTRDLEADAIRSVLANSTFDTILEIGCGTGKNTTWLAEKCKHLIAADFSEEMLQLAQQKIGSAKVTFRKADITEQWNFEKVNLISCSLVLEHVVNLGVIMEQAAATLNSGGQFYICELHPYRQLLGSRAKFEQDGNLQHLEYFVHHISDFFQAAMQHGFFCEDLQEWFDNGDRQQTPRLVSYLFKKK